ncbi:MAG: hypothetical protein ACYDEY_04280 [Acidimicrobiales bacterium]
MAGVLAADNDDSRSHGAGHIRPSAASVTPGSTTTFRHRLATLSLEVVSPAGVVLVTHRPARWARG